MASSDTAVLENGRKKPGLGVERRLTIGYLVPDIYERAQEQWYGMMDAAQKYDVNLFCFPGQVLNHPQGLYAQDNILYDLVGAENVDGVVSWASTIGAYMTNDEIQAFHDRYSSLPMLTMGRLLEGIPCLLVDGYEGMRHAIEHLIDVHGYRRLAFIRGPREHFYVEERYRAYLETLAERGIPFDPNLVTPASFWDSAAGKRAVNFLFGERKSRSAVDFEVIVAANDDLALSAIEALRERGLHVPRDVAVVGFDDTLSGKAISPSLTSVAVPFYDMGYRAIELLLKKISGAQVPVKTLVPARLVVRRSCGCLPFVPRDVSVGSSGETDTSKKTVEGLEDFVSDNRKELLSEMAQAVESVGIGDLSGMAQLLDGFVADVKDGTGDAFVTTLEAIVIQSLSNDVLVAMRNVISMLQGELQPVLQGGLLSRAQDLWQQAQVLIGAWIRWFNASQVQQAEIHAAQLREVGYALLNTFDLVDLGQALVEGLSVLGISSCYLSLYQEPQSDAYPQPVPEWSRLTFAYHENERVDLPAEKGEFRSRQLIPKTLSLRDRQYSCVVLPLYFQATPLGFVLFEVGPRQGIVYETLLGEISSALYGGLLLLARKEAEKTLQQAFDTVEYKAQVQATELQQEMAERERVQAENLRLQQDVIEAQKRSIQELSTPIIPVMERVIVVPLIGSIDTLRAKDVTRRLLKGIREHRARMVILDITGVPIVDSGVAAYLNKTIQAARLKGARTLVTGVSGAVAETIVELGIDWSEVDTLKDLQTGLQIALQARSAAENR